MKSVYIHIPFCSNICSYCDFCKIYYNKDLVDKYLEALEKEIRLNYNKEIINTLYIGGGTPTSLSINQLKTLFNIIKLLKLDNDIEFTVECNIENTDMEKLILFKENKVNRLSIGIQTFNEKYIQLLNRNHNNNQVVNLINNSNKIGINNINIDLMYGFFDQTILDLKSDLEQILKLDITHISTYSLILEENTKLYIENFKSIDSDLEYEMYKYIRNVLTYNGFNHYEISNFAKSNQQSKHNLNYWNNNNYYGFGLGAHGYIDSIRYENTRSINKYCKGNYLYKKLDLSLKEQMENEMILGLRKLSGINKKSFKAKYSKNVSEVFNVDKLIKQGDLIDDGANIYIPIEKMYISNDILINFIL